MNKVHVIVNPISARGRTGQRWQLIREALRAAFREFKYVFTEKPLHATQLARELLRDGFDLIIGVGGDGTLHEIANGYFQDTEGCAINGDASLSLLSSGTGSDFLRFQHIPRDFRRSAEHIKNAATRLFDVGRVAFRLPDGTAHRRYFVNVADFGIGAEVIRRLQATPPLKRSAMTYYRGLLRTLLDFRAPKVRISVDGEPRFEDRFIIGAVANGAIFGGGMIIAPRAAVDDGAFDLTLVRDMGRLEIIGNTPRLYRGTIERNRKVTTLKANSVEADSAEPVAVECDGELSGSLPAEFTVLPRKLNLRL